MMLNLFPFALSLSKGFDRLSLNGGGVMNCETIHKEDPP
jgi:hypothetical protein